jgi:hypothetical protein
MRTTAVRQKPFALACADCAIVESIGERERERENIRGEQRRGEKIRKAKIEAKSSAEFRK